MKILKNAHKAWSTWIAAALTTLTGAYIQFGPALKELMEPDDYMKVVFVMGALITIVRFIDQGLKNDKD